MGQKYVTYKYTLYGVEKNVPYWLAYCAEEHQGGCLHPIPSRLTQMVLTAGEAYEHYFIVAFACVSGDTWLFQANVTRPEPKVEWSH